MASSFIPWVSRPFRFRTSGTVIDSGPCYGEAEVRVESPPHDFRVWAQLAVAARGANVTDPYVTRDGVLAKVRLSPADVRRLRDELGEIIEQAEIASCQGLTR